MNHLLRAIQPPGWKRPKGYSNGIVGEGRLLFVAGQVGWDEDEVFQSEVFHEQWEKALSNVMEVIRAAGGGPEHVARLTIYVVDKQSYVEQMADVGAAWKKHMGKNYPAMAMVEVADLVEDRALVEIEATCILPKES